MKIHLLLLSVFFSFRLFGAINIPDLDVLNDPVKYDQFVLEHIDGGVVQAEVGPAPATKGMETSFSVKSQKLWTTLLIATPVVKMKVVDIGGLTVNLSGSYKIGDDVVAWFGGSATPTKDPDGSYFAGISGWFSLAPVPLQFGTVQNAVLYSKAGVELASSDSPVFYFDPAWAGQIGLGVFTSANGQVWGYDFASHVYVANRDLAVKLYSVQGDVVATYINGGGFDATLWYWTDQNSGENLTGSVPIYEFANSGTGKFLFNLKLRNSMEQGVVPNPRITDFEVWQFNAVSDKWDTRVPVRVLRDEGKSYGVDFDAQIGKFYRVYPHLRGVRSVPAKG